VAFFMPVCSGKSATSVVRPFCSSAAERFAMSTASGFVPVFVLSSLLLSGEKNGLD
jgi:hypothetical protein